MAIVNLARRAVVNSIAIAKVKSVHGAKSPDGVLDKTWENLWKVGIEGAGINSLCGTSDDLGTAALGVAPRAVAMGNAARFHYARPKQVIMDKPVHNHHGPSCFEPDGPLVARAYHKPRERIGQNLVGDAKNASERIN